MTWWHKVHVQEDWQSGATVQRDIVYTIETTAVIRYASISGINGRKPILIGLCMMIIIYNNILRSPYFTKSLFYEVLVL